MPIRYKVVAGDRRSCLTALFNVSDKRFVRTYNKGKRVVANQETIGILVSETKKQAKRFLDDWHNDLAISDEDINKYKYGKVLKVNAHGRGKKIKVYAGSHNNVGLIDFLESPDIFFQKCTHEGLMGYKSVTVLE